jgi:hypothetical protein
LPVLTLSGRRQVGAGCLLYVALIVLAWLASVVGRKLRLCRGARRPIAGCHVLVTGGSEGIGLAVALEAAAQGALWPPSLGEGCG